MRAVLVLAVIACAACNDSEPDYSGYLGANPCHDDGDCASGYACIRTEQCWPTSDLRTVRAHWTINGAAPTAATCDGRVMVLSFVSDTYGGDVSFSPVACAQGSFTLDKAPTQYDRFYVQISGNGQYGDAEAWFNDTTGDATADITLK